MSPGTAPDRLRALWTQRLADWALQPLAPPGARRAAVAVVVTEAGLGADLDGLPRHATWSADPALLLTRRALTLKQHAGQWALPGGRQDRGESAEAA